MLRTFLLLNFGGVPLKYLRGGNVAREISILPGHDLFLELLWNLRGSTEYLGRVVISSNLLSSSLKVPGY